MALYPEDEAKDLKWMIPIIQKASGDLPLCIDCTRTEGLEAALAIHKGTAIINSVNGDLGSLKTIFPLVKKYKTQVVALTSDKEVGIPMTTGTRMNIAARIIASAKEYGIPEKDIFFDPLALSIATNQNNGMLFLETLQEIKKTYPKAHIICGLSNISFGLPQRKVLNAAFMALCIGYGLDSAIMDPEDRGLMAIIRASETLVGGDPYCAGYVDAFKKGILDVWK
jgi:5-methyltetrahydrofolate--homocysteine methyltransferase